MENQKKHVIELVSSLTMGGAESLVKDYVININKKIFDVKVVIWGPLQGTPNEKIIKKSGIDIITIFKNNPKNIVEKIYRKLFRNHIVKRTFTKIDKEWGINIIHGHLIDLNILRHIAKKIKNIKMFYTIHTEPRIFLKNKKSLECWLAKNLVKRYNLVIIALHEKMQQELYKTFNISNTIVLNNCIDVGRFSNPEIKKEDVRKENNIPSNAFVVGHVGRFSYSKNHEFILKIFDGVLKKNENAYLLLVGQGPEMDNIIHIIDMLKLKNRVLILSNRGDIPQLMKSMDVFLFPSRYEGLPMTLIEAQASGLKCVISDTITSKIYLTKNITSISLDEKIDTWVDAVLRNKPNIDKTGELTDYDTKTIIKELETLYLSC